jgi:hypothetical protein
MAAATSTQSALEMDSAPSGDALTPTAASLISLWQANAIALRVEKTVNWKALRPHSVAYISGATWAIGVGQT